MPTTLRVCTLNDDFVTSRRSDVMATFRKRRPFAILAQEAKTHTYSALTTERYATAQIVRTAATSGVAVLWDTTQGEGVGVPAHRVLTAPDGAAMLARGITWQHVEVAGEIVVLASAHRPPKRYKRLWPTFDRNLVRWLTEQQHPVILGMDANTLRRGNLARRLGMSQAGRGVDAVFVTAPLKVRGARRLKKRSSDHRAVEVRVEVP